MIRIELEGISEIEDLIELIKTSYANDYRRIWQIHERTIGVFLHESIGVPGTAVYSIMTTLDLTRRTRAVSYQSRMLEDHYH